ncbi:P-loop NTPase fold protein [Limibacillus sp. MBR-115]|jgi:energy-coupling factor transporter ATP-binding protein EcfA2|uniref:KAP family P-loop NTPase fold protein n=1 Tax=Limibacillus sp. MBR-115 TaxID=3156465 RepID=UPI003393022F
MKLVPDPLEIGEKEGFTDKNDLFGYREFGQQLANVVQSSDGPLVIVLDGPWGSGKSTFAQQWAGLLRNSNTPVIEFDAFANDHYNDAFLALTIELKLAADTILKRSPKGAKKLVSNFAKSAVHATLALAPIGVGAAIKVATVGILDQKLIEESSKTIKTTIKAASDEIERSAIDAIESRLKQASDERRMIHQFKDDLHRLASELGSNSAASSETDKTDVGPDRRKHPLVIIVDELDRCRPNFSLDMLEKIKHIFSVKNVVFLLITHMHQLEASVRGAYGSDTDARAYLEKFFHLRITLPSPSAKDYGDTAATRYIDAIWQNLNLGEDTQDDLECRKLLDKIARKNLLTLRSIERLAGQISLAKRVLKGTKLSVPDLYVPLCALRHLDPSKFRKAETGELKIEDIQSLLNSESQKSFTKFWRFLLSGSKQHGGLTAEDVTLGWIKHYFGPFGPYDKIVIDAARAISRFKLIT